MSDATISVIYKWTAQPGKLDALKSIYKDVTNSMHDNEPGAANVQVFASENENALYVHDDFVDANALGFHLSQTAAEHFPDLLSIATPGPFFFMGDVPEELKAATQQMQLGAEFSDHMAGFSR